MNREYAHWMSPLDGAAHLLQANVTKNADSITYHPGDSKRTLCNKSVKRLKLRWRIDPEDSDKCMKCLAQQKVLDKKLAGDSNVVLLEERTYAGLCFGASHWFGSICLGGAPSTDLKFTLTYLQARAGNIQEGIEDDDFGKYEAGQTSTRFFTKKALRDKATEVTQEAFPHAKALMCGSRWTCGPTEVISVFGDDALTARLNEINDSWDSGELSEKTGEAEWDKTMRDAGLKI